MSIHGLKMNNAAMQRAVDRITYQVAMKAKDMGLEAMRELTTTGITEWYKKMGSRSKTLIRSMDYKVSNITQDSNFVYIDITAYLDMEKYAYFNSHTNIRKNVYKWREKHEENGWRYYGVGEPQPAIPMPMSVPEYMADLQWNQGILGLPEKGKYTSWVNPNFKQDESLYNYTSKYIADKWRSTIRQKVEKQRGGK